MSTFMYKGRPLNEPGNVDFGSTDISGIGDGTVTGAIGALSSKVGDEFKYIGKFNIGAETSIALSTGMFLLFADQGGSWPLGGLALVCLTRYDGGHGAYKIAGGSDFMNNITLTTDNACNITVKNATSAGFSVGIYKLRNGW